MKTSRHFAVAVLLAALLSWMAAAPGRATALIQSSSQAVVGEQSPGGLTATLQFGVANFDVSGWVNFSFSIHPSGATIGTGTVWITSAAAPISTSVFFPYTAVPPVNPGSLALTVTSTGTTGGGTGIMNPGFYLFQLDYSNVVRKLTVIGGGVAEGQAGTASLPFLVTINKALTAPLRFNYAGAGGTAASGGDYSPAAATATIAAGQTSVTVYVTVNGDTALEENETVGLALDGFTQYAVLDSNTPGTILTDDFLPGPAPAPVTVTELSGTGTVQAWFSVDLPAARTHPFFCSVATRNGTATAGRDYRALAPVLLTFDPGELQKWVAITVTATPELETSEQFFLDVEALDSHEVKSAACTIAPLTTAFDVLAPDIYRVRFPAGHGQRCVVEESTDLSPAGWTANSGVFFGTGAVVTHLIHGDTVRKFFRVTVLPPLPPGTAAVSS